MVARNVPLNLFGGDFCTLKPFHSQEWSISTFPCSLTRNVTPQYEELGFSSLTQMKDDHTTNSHYLTYTFLQFLKGWENLLFELGSERVNPVIDELAGLYHNRKNSIQASVRHCFALIDFLLNFISRDWPLFSHLCAAQECVTQAYSWPLRNVSAPVEIVGSPDDNMTAATQETWAMKNRR